jgi:hypothetical protein
MGESVKPCVCMSNASLIKQRGNGSCRISLAITDGNIVLYFFHYDYERAKFHYFKAKKNLYRFITVK